LSSLRIRNSSPICKPSGPILKIIVSLERTSSGLWKSASGWFKLHKTQNRTMISIDLRETKTNLQSWVRLRYLAHDLQQNTVREHIS
jgi:hypothetical protein